MQFRENDAVVVRATGKRATVRRVQPPAPPYQVEYLEGGVVEWLDGDALMLWCGCDISTSGCNCGVFKREMEHATT